MGQWHNYVPQTGNSAKLRCAAARLRPGARAALGCPGSGPLCRALQRSGRLAGNPRSNLPPPLPSLFASLPRSDKFTGTVSEIVSGDCVVVKDKASGVERRVNLSSIRAPRVGGRDRAPEPWALEAKEFLR